MVAAFTEIIIVVYPIKDNRELQDNLPLMDAVCRLIWVRSSVDFRRCGYYFCLVVEEFSYGDTSPMRRFDRRGSVYKWRYRYAYNTGKF